MSEEAPSERVTGPADAYAPTPDGEDRRPVVVDARLLATVREAVARAQRSTGLRVTPQVEQHFLQSANLLRLLRHGPRPGAPAPPPRPDPPATPSTERSVDVLGNLPAWIEEPGRSEAEVVDLVVGRLADFVEAAEGVEMVEDHLDLVLTAIERVAGNPGTTEVLRVVARLAMGSEEGSLVHVGRATARLLAESAPEHRAAAAVVTGVILHAAAERLATNRSLGDVYTADLDVIGRLAHNLAVHMTQVGLPADRPPVLAASLTRVAAVTIADDVPREAEERAWDAMDEPMPREAVIVVDELSMNAALVNPDQPAAQVAVLYALRALTDVVRARPDRAVASLFNAGVALAQSSRDRSPLERVHLNAMAIWSGLAHAVSFTEALTVDGLAGAVSNLRVAMAELTDDHRRELDLELVERALADVGAYASLMVLEADPDQRIHFELLADMTDLPLSSLPPGRIDSTVGDGLASAVAGLLLRLGHTPMHPGRAGVGLPHMGIWLGDDATPLLWMGEGLRQLRHRGLGEAFADILTEIRDLVGLRHAPDGPLVTVLSLIEARLDRPLSLAQHLDPQEVRDAVRWLDGGQEALSSALRRVTVRSEPPTSPAPQPSES